MTRTEAPRTSTQASNQRKSGQGLTCPLTGMASALPNTDGYERLCFSRVKRRRPCVATAVRLLHATRQEVSAMFQKAVRTARSIPSICHELTRGNPLSQVRVSDCTNYALPPITAVFSSAPLKPIARLANRVMTADITESIRDISSFDMLGRFQSP